METITENVIPELIEPVGSGGLDAPPWLCFT